MKINKFYLLLIVATGLVACKKDFLDVPDKRVILRQAYVKDLQTALDFLNGTYVELGGYFYNGSTSIYPELIADNIKPVEGSNLLLPHYNWSQQADDDKTVRFSDRGFNANGLWLSGYRVVKDCNFLIENIDKYKTENSSKADDIKGQAYALRALVLHQMVNVFAQPYNFTSGATHLGIPYVKSSLYTEVVSRQSVAEVYQNLISDLNQGIELMAEKPLNVKEVNKFEIMNRDAAKAILARVYLYMGDYANANRLALEVAIKFPMMTGSDYPGKLFTVSDKESLFKLTPAPANAGYTTFFSGSLFKSNKQYTATNDIGDMLSVNPSDARKSWITKAMLPSGKTVYNIVKFPSSVTGKLSSGDSDYFHTIIRSSEMVLIAAESFFRLGDEPNARIYLDKIRFRANPSLQATVLSGSALQEEIYKERNKELCFEGFRMFDLLRWKKGVQRIDPLTPAVSMLPYPSPKAIAPLPLSDVQQLGLIQNESY